MKVKKLRAIYRSKARRLLHKSGVYSKFFNQPFCRYLSLFYKKKCLKAIFIDFFQLRYEIKP